MAMILIALILFVCLSNGSYGKSLIERREAELRIIKGTETEPHAYPFMVSVREKYDGETLHNCGGSLINSNTVLTAAHCIYYPKKFVDFKIEQLAIVLGEHNMYKTEGTEVYRDVVKVILHENYGKTKAYHDGDIALLFLNESVTYTPAIQPVCISAEKNLIGTIPTVAGWGYTEEGMKSDYLQELKVPVLDDSVCSVYKKNYVAKHMICAGYPEEPVNHPDICDTDSGGPLFLDSKDENNKVQVGIVSYTSGLGCARKTYASVYTKVSAFVDWISRNTNGDVCIARIKE